MTLQEVKIDISATNATHVKVNGVCYQFDRTERGTANTTAFTTHDTCECSPAPSPESLVEPSVAASPQGGSPQQGQGGSPDPNAIAKLYSPACGFSGDQIVVNDNITAPIIAYNDKCYLYQQQVNQQPAVNDIQAGYISCGSCYDDFGSPGPNPSPTGDWTGCAYPIVIMTISGGTGTVGGYAAADTPVGLCPTKYFNCGGICNSTDTTLTRERWYFNINNIELYAGFSTNQNFGVVNSDGTGIDSTFPAAQTSCILDSVFISYDMGNGTTVTLQRGPGDWCGDACLKSF